MFNLKGIMPQLTSIVIILVLSLAAGCELLGLSRMGADEDEEAEKVILFEVLDKVDLKTDKALIKEARLEGDILTLKISHSGGCREHDYQLYGWRGWDKSNPPAGYLFFSHNANGDMCEALISRELRFDIEPLKEAWKTAFQHSGPVNIKIYEPGTDGGKVAATVRTEI